jgi:hypothetical protein
MTNAPSLVVHDNEDGTFCGRKLHPASLPLDRFGELHHEPDETILAFAQDYGLLLSPSWDGSAIEPIRLWRLESCRMAYVLEFARAYFYALSTPGGGEDRISAFHSTFNLNRIPAQLLRSTDARRALWSNRRDDTVVLFTFPTFWQYTASLKMLIQFRLSRESSTFFEPAHGFLPQIRPDSLLGALYLCLVLGWGDSFVSKRYCANCGQRLDVTMRADAKFCKDRCRTQFYYARRSAQSVDRSRSTLKIG